MKFSHASWKNWKHRKKGILLPADSHTRANHEFKFKHPQSNCEAFPFDTVKVVSVEGFKLDHCSRNGLIIGVTLQGLLPINDQNQHQWQCNSFYNELGTILLLAHGDKRLFFLFSILLYDGKICYDFIFKWDQTLVLHIGWHYTTETKSMNILLLGFISFWKITIYILVNYLIYLKTLSLRLNQQCYTIGWQSLYDYISNQIVRLLCILFF